MDDDRGDDEIFELTEDMTSTPPPAPEAEAEDENKGTLPAAVAATAAPPPDKAAPRPSAPPAASPFVLLAEPKAREEEEEPVETAEEDQPRSSRTPFQPKKQAIAVTATPIVGFGAGQKREDPEPEGEPEPEEETELDPVPDDKEDEPVDLDDLKEFEEPAEADEDPASPEASQAEQDDEEDVDGPASPEASQGEQDEEILDLGSEMMLEGEPDEEPAGDEPPAAEAVAVAEEPIPLVTESVPPPPATADEADDEAPAEEDDEAEEIEDAAAYEMTEDESEGDEKPLEDTDMGTTFDFGTPEMVFDSVEEDEEELDLDGAEDITAEEEGEEIDVSDLEEVAQPPLPAPAGPRQKPPKLGGVPRRRKRRRKRALEWWLKIFDDDYLTILPKYSKHDIRREAKPVEEGLGLAKNSLILDLACGDGRVAVEMARRGYRVVGVDMSLPMLATAGDRARDADQKINFIQGDMRDLGFEQTFDGVYCIGSSFGFFDDDTNVQVLSGVFRALKPGGTFLLDVANRDNALSGHPNLTWFEGQGAVCMEETEFDYIHSRLKVTRQLIINDGRQVKQEYSVRLYSLHELGKIMSKLGFVVSSVSGHRSTANAFFGIDSARIIIRATRPR